MPSQPATKQDLKELFHDFGATHAKQFKRIDERFDHVDKELHSVKVATADEIADVKEILNEHTAKLDRLLTNTELYDLKRRMIIVE